MGGVSHAPAVTLLLLHGDGSNGSTTIADSGPDMRGNATITGGSPIISTAKSLWGGSSIKGDTSTKFAFDLTAVPAMDEWTWETYINRDSNSTYFGMLYVGPGLQFNLDGPGGGNTYRLQIVISGTPVSNTSSAVPLTTWTHLCVQSVKTSPSNNRWYLFFDGVPEAFYDAGTSKLDFSTPYMFVGRTDSAGFAGLDAYIEEYRISVGAVYPTAGFTPSGPLT